MVKISTLSTVVLVACAIAVAFRKPSTKVDPQNNNLTPPITNNENSNCFESQSSSQETSHKTSVNSNDKQNDKQNESDGSYVTDGSNRTFSNQHTNSGTKNLTPIPLAGMDPHEDSVKSDGGYSESGELPSTGCGEYTYPLPKNSTSSDIKEESDLSESHVVYANVEKLLESFGYTSPTCIGEGKGGTVYKCTKEDGKEVAVKVIEDSGVRKCWQLPEVIKNIEHLQQLAKENKLDRKHLCIPELIHVGYAVNRFDENSRYGLFESELLHKVDCVNKRDKIKKIVESSSTPRTIAPGDTVNYGALRSFAWQVLQGLDSLQKNDLAHGDFHLGNICTHTNANGDIIHSIIDFDRCYSMESSEGKYSDLCELGWMLFLKWYYDLQVYDLDARVGADDLFNPNASDYPWSRMMLTKDKYRIHKYKLHDYDGAVSPWLYKLEKIHHDPIEQPGEYKDEWYTIKDITPGSEVDKLLKFVHKLRYEFSTPEEALNDAYFK